MVVWIFAKIPACPRLGRRGDRRRGLKAETMITIESENRSENRSNIFQYKKERFYSVQKSHDNEKLKNENTNQAQKIDAQAKEINALKADNEQMKAQIAEILKKMEMSEQVSKSVRK